MLTFSAANEQWVHPTGSGIDMWLIADNPCLIVRLSKAIEMSSAHMHTELGRNNLKQGLGACTVFQGTAD